MTGRRHPHREHAYAASDCRARGGPGAQSWPQACPCVQILGTVGEPINPEAWRWYEEIVGGSSCPIVDTWWQTETGGHMITPLPGAWAEKPGSATLPFFGVLPAILDPESGKELDGEAEGVLCIKQVSGAPRTSHPRFTPMHPPAEGDRGTCAARPARFV